MSAEYVGLDVERIALDVREAPLTPCPSCAWALTVNWCPRCRGTGTVHVVDAVVDGHPVRFEAPPIGGTS